MSTEMSIPFRFLHDAARTGNKFKVKLYLRMGFSVYARDSGKQTALHVACQTTECDTKYTVALLLKKGSDVNAQDNEGRTPLHEACGTWNKAIIFRNGEKIELMDVIDLLLRSGAGVNIQDHDGYTALHIACEENQVEVARLILRAGANLVLKTDKGETALHRAAIGGATDVVDVLLDKGEDVNAKDSSSNTPLHQLSSPGFYYSTLKNWLKTLDTLLSKGANVYAKNILEETPYDCLTEYIFSDCRFGLYEDFNIMDNMEEIFIKHVIKLRALTNQIRFDIKWSQGGVNFYNKSRRYCLELEDMKSTLIVKGISVFDVLSHKENHSYPLPCDDIRHIDEFLCSPDLLTRFPLYGHPLRVVFQRPKLLTLAVQSFYTERRKQMMKEIPWEITEKILTYLNNEDLKNFVKSE